MLRESRTCPSKVNLASTIAGSGRSSDFQAKVFLPGLEVPEAATRDTMSFPRLAESPGIEAAGTDAMIGAS